MCITCLVAFRSCRILGRYFDLKCLGLHSYQEMVEFVSFTFSRWITFSLPVCCCRTKTTCPLISSIWLCGSQREDNDVFPSAFITTMSVSLATFVICPTIVACFVAASNDTKFDSLSQMGLTFCHILSSVVYRSVASVVCRSTVSQILPHCPRRCRPVRKLSCRSLRR